MYVTDALRLLGTKSLKCMTNLLCKRSVLQSVGYLECITACRPHIHYWFHEQKIELHGQQDIYGLHVCIMS